VAANQVHGNEPLEKFRLRVLENRTHKTGEVLSALSATESPVLSLTAVVSAAVWAYDVSVRPSAVYDGVSALFLRIEVHCQGNEVVELAEIYHKLAFFLNYMQNYDKIQSNKILLYV
jgi:hypothetical protein